MRRPKNYQIYLEISKHLAKISNYLEHNDVDLKILCQLLCENKLANRANKSYKAMKAIQDVTLDPNYTWKAIRNVITDCVKDPSNIKEYNGLYTEEECKYLETISQYHKTNKQTTDDTKPVYYYKLVENSIDEYIDNGGQFKDIKLKYEKQSTIPIHRPAVPDLHSFDEVNVTEEEIAAYMDSKNKKAGCTFEEWKKTQLGVPWSWEQGGY